MILVRGNSVSIVLALFCLVTVPGLVTPFNEEVGTVHQNKLEEGSLIVESPDSISAVRLRNMQKIKEKDAKKTKEKDAKKTKKPKNTKIPKTTEKLKKPKKPKKPKKTPPSGSTDFDPNNDFFGGLTAPCGSAGTILEEGELHSADKGYDHYCLYHCGDAVCSDRSGSCNLGDERLWYRCSGGQIVNKRSQQCLNYEDNWSWDEVKVRPCDSGNDQKFDRYVTRTRKVKDAPTAASERTEFKLKARSGSDHCLSSRDCYGSSCWVGADYCNNGLKYYFFIKPTDVRIQSRFDYPHTDEDSYYPSLFYEAHDALVAMWIMYDLSRIRFDLRRSVDGTEDYLKGNNTDLEEIFFQDETAPSKGKVTLREMRDVLNDAELPQEMSIHNWLDIWNHTGKLENTTLHFFNDKLPQGSPLAYGIFVEEDEKRISVSIKGSNSEKTDRGNYFKDWTGKNAKCDFDQWKYPDGGCIGLNHRCPWVHRGYSNAVNANYEFIKGKLMELSEKFPNYKIYIFGHSMGGATAQLLGFRLASEYNRGMIPDKKLPMPISIITAASPQVANSDFQDTHVILERAGLLRNLRLRNREDWAPISVGGCEDPKSNKKCTIYCNADIINRARAVGLELDLDLYDDSFNFVYYHPVATDYQRKLESKGDIDRLLAQKPFPRLDAPYDFLEVNCDSPGLSECTTYWHNCDSYMLSFKTLIQDGSKKLNDEYEKYLGR